jgi:hypothetical protein
MTTPERLHVLVYDYVADVLERRAPHREAHLAAIAEGKQAGRIVMGGAVGDPPHSAWIVFRDPADAERFAEADPYVGAGLVTARRVEVWTVV